MITVVGIGADGWAGLGAAGRAAVEAAEVVVGGPRQLGYLPEPISADRLLVAWPTPLAEGLPGLLADHCGRALCVVASGGPMFFGVGPTLVRLLGADAVRVITHPSSVALACARLGWALEDTAVLSAVGRPLDRLRALLVPGNRILVLSRGADTPGAVHALLAEAGYGASTLTVLEQLGGPAERIIRATGPPFEGYDPLNLVAVEVAPDAATRVLGTAPGLPDDAYEHDGQLTN